MDDFVNIISHIYKIGFTHSSTENCTVYILNVNTRCDSGGYLLFEEFYFSWGCHYLFVLNELEILVDVYSGTNVIIPVKLTGNGTGDILAVNLGCDSGGYLLFDKFYFSWGKFVVTFSLSNYIFLEYVTIGLS